MKRSLDLIALSIGGPVYIAWLWTSDVVAGIVDVWVIARDNSRQAYRDWRYTIECVWKGE